MGWLHDSAPGHEGYLVGLVREDPTDSTGWRELGRGDDTEIADVAMFQVACECGWRSPRLRAPHGTAWWPHTLELPEHHEPLRDLAAELWTQHWRLPDALAARADTRVPRGAPLELPADGEVGGRLELVDEVGGLRHLLLRRPVHAGDALELLLDDGRWLPGRYENVRGDDALGALFYFDLPCAAAAPAWAGSPPAAVTYIEARLALPPEARLRWPRRR